MMTFQTVRALGMKLAGVEVGTAYGSPALTVNGRMFACMAIHRSAEPNTLVARVPLAERDALLAEAPDVYYLTDHYVAHPTVLVRLSRIHRDALHGLLAMSHRFTAAEKARRMMRRRKRSARR